MLQIKTKDVRQMKTISSLNSTASTTGYITVFNAAPCTIYAKTGLGARIQISFVFSFIFLLIVL